MDFAAGGVFKNIGLFTQEQTISDHLRASSKLNVKWGLGGLPHLNYKIKELISAMTGAWVSDANELCGLLAKWTNSNWRVSKDSILSPGNKALVDQLVGSTDYSRCGRGAQIEQKTFSSHAPVVNLGPAEPRGRNIRGLGCFIPVFRSSLLWVRLGRGSL